MEATVDSRHHCMQWLSHGGYCGQQTPLHAVAQPWRLMWTADTIACSGSAMEAIVDSRHHCMQWLGHGGYCGQQTPLHAVAQPHMRCGNRHGNWDRITEMRR